MTLGRLRVRLTLWYAATFVIILGLLGAAVFVAIGVQVSRRLDVALRAATAAVKTATAELETERAAGGAADAVEELQIPDRALYLFDATARPMTPPRVAPWIDSAAHAAVAAGPVDVERAAASGGQLRLHAERFTTPSGTAYVAAAVATRPQIVDQYAWLIGTFAAATLGALILVIAGGFLLARQSTMPVEQSMEQMRRFMADAAHELRTPITLLRTRTDVALAQPRDPTGDAAAFQAIAREADRLGGIVGDLLMLARADAGERRVVRASLYLDDLVSKAVSAVHALAERKGVALVVGSFEEAQIQGDPELVERLLLIVLDNAIKYTTQGGQVRLDVTARDGHRSVIISDSGVGIPADELPRIFERFYRGEGARGRAEGAGLGLPIARWIADLHGARLAVSSDTTGTRVQIDFPPGPRPVSLL
jgi:signal transduction histidine kinase